MHGEMPGFFPGRPGGEHDEPLLDMILERRPIPPEAPPEIHGLAHMLAAVAGPAEPGELTGQAAALAAFARLGSPAGISHAVPRSARRSMPERRARGRLPLAAALTAVTAGLGSTAAAYAGVLPGPIQDFAHVYIGAPASHHDASRQVPAVASSPTDARPEPATSAPQESHEAASPARPHGHGKPRDWGYNGLGYAAGNNLASCQPSQNQTGPGPASARATPSPGQIQNQGQAQGQDPSQAIPSQNPTPPGSVPGWVSPSPTAAACASASLAPSPGR
jgi:hypothetical protein